MFCHKCGNQLPDGAKFCQNCGEKIISANNTKKKMDTSPASESGGIHNKNVLFNLLKKKKPKKLQIIFGTMILGICVIMFGRLCLSHNDTNKKSSITDQKQKSDAINISDYTSNLSDAQCRALIDRTRMTLGIGNSGNWSNCAIQPDGTLWNWYGRMGGLFGYCGDDRGEAVQKIMDDVVGFSSSELKLLVIKSDGSLWSWEREDLDGSLVGNPTQVMDDVVAASTGNLFSMAIDSSGSLWAWGVNSHGQLGDGTTEERHEPVKIMKDVVAISSSDFYSMAIDSSGSLWAWGANSHGQLGDGTTEERHEPVKIMKNVVAISTSDFCCSMALQSDGSLWAWGQNSNGLLGDGTTEDHYSPIKIMEDVICFSTGSDVLQAFAVAVQSDGSLWAWGNNVYGQLGIGDQPYHSIEPVHVMDNIAYVLAFDEQYVMAVGNDDSLWIWGKGVDLIKETNGTSDSKEHVLSTPFQINLVNLPHTGQETDWLMVGNQSSWGIAGFPPTWNVIRENSYRVFDTMASYSYSLVSENGDRLMVGYISNERDVPYGYETDSLSGILFGEDISDLSYETFAFNDGNRGLMIKHAAETIWVNGSAVMEGTHVNENMLDIARTLCDRYRDNSMFLNAIERKIAEIEPLADEENITDIIPESGMASVSENELFYNDILVSTFFESSIDDVIKVLGTPVDENGITCIYDEITFYLTESGRILSCESWKTEDFSINGVTLNKNRDELFEILGTPTEEGDGGNGYVMIYDFPTYTLSFDLGEPELEAWRLSIYTLGDSEMDFNRAIENFELSGFYRGSTGQSNISISIFSSQEEGEMAIGEAVIYVENVEYYYGEIVELEENVYRVDTDTGEEVILVASASEGLISLQLYVEGQYIEEYWMEERYVS